MKIRPENRVDYQKIHSLINESFATAEHADGNEAELVEALRAGTAYLPELTLVMEDKETIIGFVMFTKAKFSDQKSLVLSPIAIAPEWQKQGIGSQLIEAGHAKAKEMGFDLIFVLGSDVYYPKFGYQNAQKLGVTIPNDFPSQYFMVLPLAGQNDLSGQVRFADEFGITD
ncbi:GNAT family N-acetyltransferase [Streptococcus hongkongensis]|nr:GNAT family acetyltransferase [Streptococcus uberis]